jgi:ABC-type lipoprotein export system ATPase subunit
LQRLLEQIASKFKRNSNGKLSKTGVYKSVLSKSNLYNIPEELDSYRPFITNTEINIPWIDWKSKGDAYDVGDSCPYCSETLNRTVHDQRKEVFKKTYKKADSQNLKDLLELLENLRLYIKPEKYDELVSYVKTDVPEDIVSAILEKLLLELDVMLNRFAAIVEFGNRRIALADISKLDQKINEMEIPGNFFEIFGGEKSENIIRRINTQVSELRSEAAVLKREMGALKGVMQATIQASQADINEFLKTAGINYELVILVEDETNSRTILKQCFSEERTDVTKIREHLSWGEKNAFALILFMYYAVMQSPDLIILDDPISSFDTNKKYAILHRMFKNIGKRDVSLEGKTVLFLTHDFEPITDFIVVGKLGEEKAQASFICNEHGIVKAHKIDPNSDVKLITIECSDIAKNININIVSRVAFLRKLSELNGRNEEWDLVYEILSCLIHANEIKRKIGNNTYVDIASEDIALGITKIKEYIPDFDYDELKNNIYTKESVKNLYNIETNAYLKVQLFREMNEILTRNEVKITQMDGAWYKFIDETYHIENDYLHFLDIIKFNIVPSYIIENVDKIVSGI